MWANTYTHTHIHTCIHAHTCIRTCIHACNLPMMQAYVHTFLEIPHRTLIVISSGLKLSLCTVQNILFSLSVICVDGRQNEDVYFLMFVFCKTKERVHLLSNGPLVQKETLWYSRWAALNATIRFGVKPSRFTSSEKVLSATSFPGAVWIISLASLQLIEGIASFRA